MQCGRTTESLVSVGCFENILRIVGKETEEGEGQLTVNETVLPILSNMHSNLIQLNGDWKFCRTELSDIFASPSEQGSLYFS